MNVKQIKTKWQYYTNRIEPWWSLVGAPIVEESIFRFISYQAYLVYGGFYTIGIASSILFAAIHGRFGKWFVLYAFIGGFIAWIVMVSYGLLWSILFHSATNMVLLKFGILQKVKEKYLLAEK